MKKDEKFSPYVSADQKKPEFTKSSIITGIILAVVFGAANAYLGLKVGLTVSASIPAAVISMGVYRKVLRKNSILESNMVQTIGSAGESLAAGAIFTIPAMFLWAGEGVMEAPSLLTVTVIALCGGILGVLFMVPLRKALIVNEHEKLPYPEGTACAEVLLAGEKGGTSAGHVFKGMGFAALLKFLVDGLKLAPGVIGCKMSALKTEFSAEVYPALVGVGYICGPKISGYLFAGGLIGWFVLIPVIVLFGGNTVMFPQTDSITNVYANGGTSAIWSSYIKYIGAGAVAAAGIISLIKTLPMLCKAFVAGIKGMKNAGRGGESRTERDMSIKYILIGVVVLAILMCVLPQIPISILGSVLIIIFGFFFATVSSRMVGIVGSSNNPGSGMTIATLLIATGVLKLAGNMGAGGMQGAIAIGSVVCILTAVAGDTSQDLKTGYILGATPVKQQLGELIGAVAAAVSIGGVMLLLDKAWGFGSTELAAPQATLMKMIVEGVMDGNLPWGLIFIGAFLAIAIELFGIPALAVSIGIYLPLELTSTIMIGGIVRLFIDKKKKSEDTSKGNGVLFCSGMIAGEGLIGILLAILAVAGIDKVIDLSRWINTGTIGGIVLMAAMVVLIILSELKKDKE